MLKDTSTDPSLGINAKPLDSDAFSELGGEVTYTAALSSCQHKSALKMEMGPPGLSLADLSGKIMTPGSTTRSSHKVVTPVRRQNASFLVENLELFLAADSEGINDQIAKLTAAAKNPASTICGAFRSPATKLAVSLSAACCLSPKSQGSLGSCDALSSSSAVATKALSSASFTDPSLLQSHIQRSLEEAKSMPPLQIFSLDTPSTASAKLSRTTGIDASNSATSPYKTPTRKHQPRSQDLNEFCGNRLMTRRSSLVLQHNSLFESFQSDEREEQFRMEDQFEETLTETHSLGLMQAATWSASTESIVLNECENDSEADDAYTESFTMFSTERKKRVSQDPLRSFKLPTTNPYKDGSKPSYSYASLIAQAILSNSKHRLALNGIYTWIMQKYPYYQLQSCGWQNSIRHNLSLNRCFKKIPRDDDEPGKGAYWTIDLEEMDDFEDGMFKRRRSGSGSSLSGKGGNDGGIGLQSPQSSGGLDPLLIPHNPHQHQHHKTPLKSQKSLNVSPFTNYYNKTNISTPMGPNAMTPNVKTLLQTPLVLTPKIAASCPGTWSRSPYSSAYPMKKDNRTFNFNDQLVDPASKNGGVECNMAAFWSYPNLTLNQMGLNADPPSPDGKSFSIEQFFDDLSNNNSNSSEIRSNSSEETCNDSSLDNSTLLQGASVSCLSDKSKLDNSPNDRFNPLSPLSWLLAQEDSSTTEFFQQNLQNILSR